MAELDEALITLTTWLDRMQTPYMVIGGFAVTVWGEPRFTRDLDVTVSVSPEQFQSVIGRIAAEFTPLASDSLKFATDTRVLPIVVDSVPVDIVFAALPYEEAAISRARTIELRNGSVRICSPEDLILYKIVSSRPRDHEDVEGVVRRPSMRPHWPEFGLWNASGRNRRVEVFFDFNGAATRRKWRVHSAP